jgi:hypothetical protein
MVFKGLISFEKGIAVRALDHLNAHLFASLLQQPSGATVGIDDEDLIKVTAVLGNSFFDSLRNPFGVDVQYGGQASQGHMIPAVALFQMQDFARQRTACQ